MAALENQAQEALATLEALELGLWPPMDKDMVPRHALAHKLAMIARVAQKHQRDLRPRVALIVQGQHSG